MIKCLGLRVAFLVLIGFLSSCSIPQAEHESADTPEDTLGLATWEQELLFHGFRQALKYSELDSVLFGDKPVCIDGVPLSPFVHNAMHGRGCVTRGFLYLQALAIWEKLEIHGEDWSFIRAAPTSPQQQDLGICLWVNHSAVQKVISEHIDHFRTELSPNVTADYLLERLCTPGVDLKQLLGHNRILIGLVLGFGLENSISHDFMADCRSFFAAGEMPPLRHRAQRLLDGGMLQKEMSHGILKRPVPSLKKEHLRQAFADTVVEDYMDTNTTNILSVDHPIVVDQQIPLFSCDLRSKKTEQLIRSYAQANERGRELVSHEDFLSHITSLLASHPFTITPNGDRRTLFSILSLLPRKEVSLALAHAAWLGSEERDAPYFDGMISGIIAAEGGDTTFSPNAWHKARREEFDARHAISLQNNLEDTHQLMALLSEESETNELIPDRLYIRTKKVGSGPGVSEETLAITCYYQFIEYPSDSPPTVLADSFAAGREDILLMTDLLPSLQLAIIGMRRGEIREMIVHPSIAFGYEVDTNPGTAIHGTVQLVDFGGREGTLSQINPIPEPSSSRFSETSLLDLRRKTAYEEGRLFWSHFSQAGSLVDCGEFIRCLEGIRKGTIQPPDDSLRTYALLQAWLAIQEAEQPHEHSTT